MAKFQAKRKARKLHARGFKHTLAAVAAEAFAYLSLERGLMVAAADHVPVAVFFVLAFLAVAILSRVQNNG